MSAVRDWYMALDPELREYLRKEVLFVAGEPTDVQIAELPDLVKHEWRLDAMEITPEMRPRVLAAAAEVAQLRGSKPTRKSPSKRKR